MNPKFLFKRLFNATFLKPKHGNLATEIRETSPLQVEHLEPRMMLNGDGGTVIFEAGFEDADVAVGDFDFFQNVSGFTATRGAVEIQNTHPAVGPAAEGAKHLELDGDNEIEVDIDFASAAGLTLDLQYSPRGGANVLENEIEVLWNDEVVATLSADGTNNRSTNFRSFSINLPIENDSTDGQLVFRSKFSGGRGVGGLLDNILVTAELSPLTIEAIADQTVEANSTFSIDADLQSPNSAVSDVNFQLVNAPAGATIDPETGLFRWLASDDNIAATQDRETETIIGPPQTVFFAGFEDVEVSSRRFDFFDSISGFTATGGNVEVQKDHPAVGPASEGSQHVELDGQNGIVRSIDTVEGDLYELTFDFSPRAGADAETNAIEVLWDGEVIHEVSADGRGNRSTDFSTVAIDLSDFTSDQTQLEFRSKEAGAASGLGGLIDNVRVTRRAVTTVTSENPFEVIIRATDSNGRTDTETFNFFIDQDEDIQNEPPVVIEPPVVEEPLVVIEPPVVVEETPVVVEEPPVTQLSPLAIEAITDQTVEANSTFSIDADLQPPNSDVSDVNFQLVNAPAGATINPETGLFRWLASDNNVNATIDRETETIIGPPQTVFFAGFEDVEVSSRRFDFFDSISGFTATGGNVEVQKNHPAVGPASEGSQHLELDGQNGIVRSIDTVEGDLYELTFDFSPRAGADAETNAIEVLWDGEVIHEVTADGRDNRSTDYSTVAVDLSDFTGDQTLLEFRSKAPGTAPGLGGLIDNVRVNRRAVTTVTSENPFEVIIRATDSNGRTDTETFNFSIDQDEDTQNEPPVVVDETAPIVLINPIVSAEAGAVTISGTSTDNLAVDRNRLLLFNKTTEQYWDGSAWTSQWSRIEPSGTEDWTFTIDLSEGDYRAVAWTWDAFNNRDSNLINFTVEPVGSDVDDLSIAIENLNETLDDGWSVATRIEGNDIWFRTLDPNGNAQIDFRFGSSGVIAEIRDVATGDNLLAPTFQGEVTDRVVQWTLWELGQTVQHDVASLPDFEDRFNVTQAGTFDNVLNGTVDVDLNSPEGQIDVWAVADNNWKSELDPYIEGTITSLTRTKFLDGGAVLVRRIIRIGEISLNGESVSLDNPYFESWTPLSDSVFDSLALSIDDNGNPDDWFADGRNIPNYPDEPVANTRGWATSYDRGDLDGGLTASIVFGTDKGTRHRADGLETSNHGFNFNSQDFAGGVAILPGLYPGSLNEGAIIDQHILFLPGSGIDSETPAQLDALAAQLPAPQIYRAGAELDGELSAIAVRLSGLADEPRVATDNLARLV